MEAKFQMPEEEEKKKEEEMKKEEEEEEEEKKKKKKKKKKRRRRRLHLQTTNYIGELSMQSSKLLFWRACATR